MGSQKFKGDLLSATSTAFFPGTSTPMSAEHAPLLDVEHTGDLYGSDRGPSKAPSLIDTPRLRMSNKVKYYIPATSWIPNYSLSL
jgi:hypothetical protein